MVTLNAELRTEYCQSPDVWNLIILSSNICKLYFWKPLVVLFKYILECEVCDQEHVKCWRLIYVSSSCSLESSNSAVQYNISLCLVCYLRYQNLQCFSMSSEQMCPESPISPADSDCTRAVSSPPMTKASQAHSIGSPQGSRIHLTFSQLQCLCKFWMHFQK